MISVWGFEPCNGLKVEGKEAGMAGAVLIVDMLRGFLEEGNPLYCGAEARNIIPTVQGLLARERERGASLIYICDNHAPDDKEFRMFPVHCVRGTKEAEVIPDLARYPGVVVPKTRYSGFYGTDLEQRLRALAPERLIVVGVCTDICVLHTTADARNRDYEAAIPTDCVASFDPEAHKWALRHMEKILGARLTTAAEV